MYIHVPKEKRSKLEPFGKKGIFVGYSETSKAYRIYVPGQRFIEVSRDVTFHEEVAFPCSREMSIDAGMEEHEAPVGGGESLDEPPSPDGQREDYEERLDAPVEEPIERLLEESPVKRRPAWCRQILQEAEGHAAPKGTFRESRNHKGFLALLHR